MTASHSSSKGITPTVLGWGKHAQATHSPPNVPKIPDVTLSQLGYWTDNGAYYYFYGKPSTKAYVANSSCEFMWLIGCCRPPCHRLRFAVTRGILMVVHRPPLEGVWRVPSIRGLLELVESCLYQLMLTFAILMTHRIPLRFEPEMILRQVVAAYREIEVPIKYIQLDAWWYRTHECEQGYACACIEDFAPDTSSFKWNGTAPSGRVTTLSLLTLPHPLSFWIYSRQLLVVLPHCQYGKGGGAQCSLLSHTHARTHTHTTWLHSAIPIYTDVRNLCCCRRRHTFHQARALF